VEEVTHCRRILVLTAVTFSILFNSSLHAQRPSERYQGVVEAGRLEPRVRAFVSSCLGTEKLPKPVQFYSQGEWFVTPDLASHMKEQGSDDDGTAQVWELDQKPRAVSLWVHDDEFDRSTLACLDKNGVVREQVNEYMPGLSEPDLHWIYVHTFNLQPGGKYNSSGHYTDWNRVAIHPPKLTSEDKDFIAGERQYARWNDFDFAEAMQRSESK
jgi:hypothetical protein